MQLPAVPMRVTGAVQASRARVFYVEDTLYVFNTPTTFVEFESNPPVKRGRGFVADGPSGTLAFEKNGCSCSWRLSGPAHQYLKQIETARVG